MDRLPLELLTGLPAVLSAAEEGSATRAAGRLGATPATVLRRIEGAETALGVRLFDRMPTGLVATAALRAILPWAKDCAASFDGMQRELAGLDLAPAGRVRLATPPTVASHLLMPQLSRLRDSHPHIELEFASANTVTDLAQLEADLAVRVMRPTTGDLVTKKLSDYAMVVACSPALALAFRSNEAGLPWVTWDGPMAHAPEARWLEGARPNARIGLRASDLHTLLAAASAGVGAVLVAEPIGALHGGLVRFPLEDAPLPRGSLWLVAHQALVRVPRVAAVWDWLTEYFASGVGTHLTLPEQA